MNSASKLIFVAFTLGLALPTNAYAQSPREQLQQLTIQLQQAPNDNTLRERIIKLGAEIKPAPAVPEEARRSFIEGVTIVKAAKDVGSQKLAIGSFTEALKIAPWWGDAYYNLAVAQELTGQLNDAERTLKWFLLTNPGESEAREAQDRIYGLSAKRKLAAAEAGAKQEQAARELTTQAQRFVGDWVREVKSNTGNLYWTLTIGRDAGDGWRVELTEFKDPYDIKFVGTELRFKHDWVIPPNILATYKVSATLSADGNTLRLAYMPMRLTAWQEAYFENDPRDRPSPYTYEYMKH